MNRHKLNQIEYLSFESLDRFDSITNAFSTRKGGVSTGYHSSMNLGFSNGDDPILVAENFKLFSDVLGINVDHIVRTHQTHTTNIHKVTHNDVFTDGLLHTPDYTNIDGLICDIPGIALATFYADCVPLYFVDPVKNAIGLSHSGWRGTVARMGAATIKALCEEYGSNVNDIYCAIGPSICQSCYEISKDVAEEFIKEFNISDINSNKLLSQGKTTDKFQLNLWECNKQVLLDAGIIPDHIECANLCTCCNSDWLFSHRASNGKRGNLGAFLMLNKQ